MTTNRAVGSPAPFNTGFDFEEIGILQPKLSVSQPGDIYEQEADVIAEQVMRMSAEKPIAPPLLRNKENIDRKCAACEMKEEDEEKILDISRKPSTSSNLEATDEVGSEINSLKLGSGSSLDANTSEFMEQRFGYNFGHVRVHTGKDAETSAQKVSALAYTIGSDIVFGKGQYAPGTSDGKRLLAHELAHVVQQGLGASHSLQRQEATCHSIAYDPLTQCCCDGLVTTGQCTGAAAGCAHHTSRDNEYDGCSVPAWLERPNLKDNPGQLPNTRFSDPAIHGTQPQYFIPTLPCDVHDKCYQTCGSDRNACDQQLFSHARAVCDNSLTPGNEYVYQWCIDAVEQAERLLPLGSKGAFDQRQREYCACCPEQAEFPSSPVIYFDTNEDTLDNAALIDLTSFVERYRGVFNSGAFELTLIGHASTSGSEEYNKDLSMRRVASVRTNISGRLDVPLQHVDEYYLGEEWAQLEGPPDTSSPDYQIVQIILIDKSTP